MSKTDDESRQQDDERAHRDEAAGHVTKKRAYDRPVLRTYGDFHELTRATTKGGEAQDGAGKPSSRVTGIPT